MKRLFKRFIRRRRRVVDQVEATRLDSPRVDHVAGNATELVAATPSRPVPIGTELEHASNPDEVYAEHQRMVHGSRRVTPLAGELMTVRVIGRLRDGSLAWENESMGACGHFPSELLGDMDPLEGDTIRVLVVGHVWGHHTLDVVPNSLRSPFTTRPVRVDGDRGVVPDGVRETWMEGLVPGDVVLASVPYDGLMPIDRLGRSSKERPSVFIRWENDYAVLRPIYGRDGYVQRQDLGVPLVDTRCLRKASVVRNAEFDLQPERLIRRMGSLGDVDVRSLGMRRVSQSCVKERVDPSDRVRDERPRSETSESAFVARHRNAIRPERHQGRAIDGHVLVGLLIEEVESDPIMKPLVEGEGLTLASFGNIFVSFVAELRLAPITGKFQDLVTEVIAARDVHSDRQLILERNDKGHPVLRLRGATSRSNSVQGGEMESTRVGSKPLVHQRVCVQLALGDDYLAPDLIILDQYSAATMVGDARLRLDDELARLRVDGNAPAYVMGSDEEASWRAFQAAASRAGWTLLTGFERSDQIRRVLRAVEEAGAYYVTVVGKHADVIAELESCGCEVTVLSEIVECSSNA